MVATRLNNKTAEKFGEALAVVSDVDKTLIKAKGAQCSVSLIKHKYEEKEFNVVAFGILSGIVISSAVGIQQHIGRNEFGSRNSGLKAYYEVMGKVDMDANLLRNLVVQGIQKYELPGAREMLESLRVFGKEKEKKVILTTANSSLNAEMAALYFHADSWVANPVIYKGDKEEKIAGIKILMRNPNLKRELTEEKLKENNIPLNKCIFIGDSESDRVAFGGKVLAFVASPLATHKVIENADLFVRNYAEFADDLRRHDFQNLIRQPPVAV